MYRYDTNTRFFIIYPFIWLQQHTKRTRSWNREAGVSPVKE